MAAAQFRRDDGAFERGVTLGPAATPVMSLGTRPPENTLLAKPWRLLYNLPNCRPHKEAPHGDYP